MIEFDNQYIDSSNVEGGGCYQLDVDINQVTFSNHYLCNRTHVLKKKKKIVLIFPSYLFLGCNE